MSRMLETATPDTPVDELARLMNGRRISGVPIVDAGRLVGVVTRTDLIQLGAFQAGRRWTTPAMVLPRRRAAEVMTVDPVVITPTAPLRLAGRLMSDRGIHRLFVVGESGLVGVICAVDLAAAVRDARIETPLSEVMTQPILSVDVHAPISGAIDLLAHVPVTALIVTEHGGPIGTFSQDDVLACRDLPRSTPIDTVYDAAVICLPAATPLHRVAAHAAQLEVRRVLACRDREAIGIVSGLDFARVVGGARIPPQELRQPPAELVRGN